MTPPRFGDSRRAARLARSHQDVVSGGSRDVEKMRELGDGHREVRIREKAPGAARLEHAAPHGRAFPRVRRAHEPDARVAPHRILDDRRRAIAAPVVNDEDVGVEGEAVECGEHLAERLCDARLLVERRNDNRQKRRTHRLWKRST